MNRKTIFYPVLFLLTIFLIGCQQKLDNEYIDLEIQFNTPLYSNVFTDITYNWKLKEGLFDHDPDYKVFVHFWQKSTDMMLLQDDHPLPWTADRWKAGAELSYTHEDLFIPNFIDYLSLDYGNRETIVLSAGLYHPDREDSKQVLLRRELEVDPRPMDYPRITYARGWYPRETVEYQVVDPWKTSWRWTKQEAELIADNLGSDLDLYIYGQGRADILEEQELEIRVKDTLIDRFQPGEEIFRKTYRIGKEILGEEDEFIITLRTSETFRPAETGESDDERQLGVRIMLINLLPAGR